MGHLDLGVLGAVAALQRAEVDVGPAVVAADGRVFRWAALGTVLVLYVL